jgi:voltage-gated potassium channel Kch
MRGVNRRVKRFFKARLSVRRAMAVLVTAMVVVVFAGGVLIRLAEPEKFPGIGIGMWWALQTVTTVGYGDVIPQTVVGRLVGAVIMLESIAFISIITASITSAFVSRARRERVAHQGPDAAQPEDADLAEVGRRLDDIAGRLDRIEGALTGRTDHAAPPTL